MSGVEILTSGRMDEWTGSGLKQTSLKEGAKEWTTLNLHQTASTDVGTFRMARRMGRWALFRDFTCRDGPDPA